MTSSFEQWRSKDQLWLEENFRLLTEVFQWFLRRGEWPEVEALQHAMFQTGDRTTKVREIANSRPSIPGQFSLAFKPTIPLGARHLIRIPAAATLLTVTVVATRLAVAKFLSAEPGEHVSLVSLEIQGLTLGQASTLERLPNFTMSDNPTAFAGGGGTPDWTVGIDRDLVMEFEGIESSSDYVDRQLRVIRGWCDEYDIRTGSVQKNEPYKGFIVMPFGEPWSDTVHSLIRRANDALDGRIVSIRADDIADPGRITNQIAEQLANCDFVIADITGNNPNVAWELGYAFAYNKPAVLLRSKDAEGQAPFDIYDHRWTEYSAVPTDEEERRLTKALEATITLLTSRYLREPDLWALPS